MNASSERAERERLTALRLEHRKLDEMIRELEAQPVPDQLLVTRLKKQKLTLKDAITTLEDRLFPDIIA